MLPLSLGIVFRTAMLAVGLAAAIPTKLGHLDSHANPARDFAQAMARWDAVRLVDDSIAAPGGQSLLHTHGGRTARVVVLLHGLTDSPRQFAAVADSLFAEGDNVYTPRLPHHAERGADVSALARMTAEELARFGDATVDLAAGLGDTVIVVGLSAGAMVGAWIAQYRPEVRRVVMIAPPFEVSKVPSILERPLVSLTGRVPNVTRRSARDSTRPDLDPGIATRSLAQLLRLGIAVRRTADERPPKAVEMAFLINANDHTVKPAPVYDLAGRWRARGATVVVYEFPETLRLPHNVLKPIDQGDDDGSAVFAVIKALAHGDHPPGPAARLQASR